MKYTLTFFLLFIVNTINAQNYKFGKVSVSELKQEAHDYEKNAHAAILMEDVSCEIYFETKFWLKKRVFKRIKIYDAEGFEWANMEVNLREYLTREEMVRGIKGCTYNLENGKVVKTKLTKDNIHYEKVDQYYSLSKMIFPQIRNGSVIEIQYTVISPFLSAIMPFKVQYSIPVDKYKFHFESPDYFNYRKHIRGRLTLNAIQWTKSGRILFSNISRQGGGLYAPVTSSHYNSYLDINMDVYEFALDNVPSVPEEDYVKNMNNYRASLMFELGYVHFPDQPLEVISQTWGQIADEIYGEVLFKDELKKNKYFIEDINEIKVDKQDTLTTINKVFNFVCKKVMWNGLYDKYAEDGVEKAYAKKSGNSAEINLMLTSILRYLGYDANPVLLSTTDMGLPLFPLIYQYNYVISSVKVGGEIILLDGTNPYGGLNILPLRCLNWQGSIVYNDGSSEIISLNPHKGAMEISQIKMEILESGRVVGNCTNSFSGYSAVDYSEQFLGVSQESYTNYLEAMNSNLIIDSVHTEVNAETNSLINESFNFKMDNEVDVVDDRIYFSPLFFSAITKNKFKVEKRIFPVEIPYPFTEKIIIQIKIPEGYTVESVPNPVVMKLPDGVGKYKYIVAETPTGLNLIITRSIKRNYFEASYYQTLKEFYDILITKEGEKIVLKKS